MRRLITGVVTIGILAGITLSIIFYARGYQLDLVKKKVKGTGSLVATSTPDGGAVFIDGRFTTATNNTIQLDPGWYEVKITKDGFVPWQKRLHIEVEVVTKTDALLFPVNPALSPLTTTGVNHFSVSPDGAKIAFVTPSGVFVLDLENRLLSINRFPRQILDFSSLPTINNSPASTQMTRSKSTTLLWSPDSKQLLLLFWNPAQKSTSPNLPPNDFISEAYLLDSNRINTLVNNINFQLANLLASWQQEKTTKQNEQLLAFPKEIARLASSSATIIAISPDETKILYRGKITDTLSKVLKASLIGSNSTPEERRIQNDRIYVYDLKEDKNYPIFDWKPQISKPLLPANALLAEVEKRFLVDYAGLIPDLSYPIHWYPDSRHLILMEANRITIMEYDGINRTSVYAGPFIDGFIAPWPSGGKIVILTNLNSSASERPNLYLVNFR